MIYHDHARFAAWKILEDALGRCEIRHWNDAQTHFYAYSLEGVNQYEQRTNMDQTLQSEI